MKKNQDKSNDKQNISQKYEKYGNSKTTYQTVTFCKLGKCIMYHNVGRNYRSSKRFVCKAMTPILIPVRIFFILGRQIASSRESRSHVLEFLVRTLLIISYLLLLNHKCFV